VLEEGNLATPKSVQKLQTALHAKAKAAAGDRFYALYDKISRDDILAHTRFVRQTFLVRRSTGLLPFLKRGWGPVGQVNRFFDHGRLQAGKIVLIHGGSGGVGHFAVQFAKVKGATVLTTVSRPNLDFVRELGADRAIDYQSQRFEEIGREVDLVLDLVGGETQERSWSVLKPGGILVSALGAPSSEKAIQHGAQGVGYRAQPNPAQLAEIGRLIDEGKIRPVVSATYPLAEARQAQERLEQGHVRGKIVLVVAE
jgi:D-arabinose 1-dehydrogenase-like Zn-dependent alcohol dehydrogenase